MVGIKHELQIRACWEEECFHPAGSTMLQKGKVVRACSSPSAESLMLGGGKEGFSINVVDLKIQPVQAD